MLGEKKAYIRQAPEPEDIIWTNLGQSLGQIIKKKMITFFVTLVVIGASFAAVYGLSVVQTRVNKSNKNQYISILISLVISIFNIILIRTLSLTQRCSGG